MPSPSHLKNVFKAQHVFTDRKEPREVDGERSPI
jgi:hypothetical protein